MRELILAIQVEEKYNQMNLEDCIKEFEKYTGQQIPESAIHDFKSCGLNNVDLLTSDFLNKYGIKNLLQS